jgi:hypothetical protein
VWTPNIVPQARHKFFTTFQKNDNSHHHKAIHFRIHVPEIRFKNLLKKYTWTHKFHNSLFIIDR